LFDASKALICSDLQIVFNAITPQTVDGHVRSGWSHQKDLRPVLLGVIALCFILVLVPPPQ
jgi:hypothetical protein